MNCFGNQTVSCVNHPNPLNEFRKEQDYQRRSQFIGDFFAKLSEIRPMGLAESCHKIRREMARCHLTARTCVFSVE